MIDGKKLTFMKVDVWAGKNKSSAFLLVLGYECNSACHVK